MAGQRENPGGFPQDETTGQGTPPTTGEGHPPRPGEEGYEQGRSQEGVAGQGAGQMGGPAGQSETGGTGGYGGTSEESGTKKAGA